MGAQFTRSIGEILRSTLQKLEETPDFRQDDTAVIELKKHIVRAIAELEVAKSAHSSEPTRKADEPVEAEATLPPAESGILANAVVMSASATSAPETAEAAAVIDELPLLAENGTATAT